MTTLSQDIRAALQVQAATAAGLPSVANRAYEGAGFEPLKDTNGDFMPYVRMVYRPTVDETFSLTGYAKVHRGLFDVLLYYSSGEGTAAIEAVGDAVAAAMPTTQWLRYGNACVRIDRVTRYGVMVESDPAWLMLMLRFLWHGSSDTA